MLKRKSGDQSEHSYKKTVPIEKRRKMFHGEYVASGQVPRESIPIIPDTDAFIEAFDNILKVSEPHVVFVCQEIKDKLDVLKRQPKKEGSNIHLSKSALKRIRKQFENDTKISYKAQSASNAIEQNLLKKKFYGTTKLLNDPLLESDSNTDILMSHALILREKGFEPILLTADNCLLRIEAGSEKLKVYDVKGFKKEKHFFE